jgi:hypothetical protein
MRALIYPATAIALASSGLLWAQVAQRVTPTDATTSTASGQAPAAASQATAPAPPLRLAAIDTSDGAFRKLDTDHDGRISALEANQNPRVAAAFPMADRDKDGYLSREEFEALNRTLPKPPDVDASTPSGDAASDPGGDQRATPPSE